MEPNEKIAIWVGWRQEHHGIWSIPVGNRLEYQHGTPDFKADFNLCIRWVIPKICDNHQLTIKYTLGMYSVSIDEFTEEIRRYSYFTIGTDLALVLWEAVEQMMGDE